MRKYDNGHTHINSRGRFFNIIGIYNNLDSRSGNSLSDLVSCSL